MTRKIPASWRCTVPALLLAAAACSGTPPIADCEAAAGIEPDCRFQNPEDLVVSPGGGHLLVSQMGSMDGSRAGNLVSYEPQSGSIERLFPRRDMPAPEHADGWGDPACPPPDLQTFSPHGIDLETIEGNRHALYVINHGGRESVEMFEVEEAEGVPQLTWRGCVVAPEGGYFNDLVVLRDGGFWVSHMFPRDANITWTLLRMQVLGYRPGHAYAWHQDSGFTKIPGSQVKFGNGVEKSEDERVLFLNSYFGNAVIALDVASGERLASVPVASPDNLAWAPNGELLAASHHGSLADTLACQDIESGSCGFRFQVVAIDPGDWSQRVLLDHAGPPMGAATVAVPFGSRVFLGTFAGDRVASVSAEILER
jgi:hypothetical protein